MSPPIGHNGGPALTDPTPELEPITVTIPQCMRITGKSRSAVYEAIGRGELEAVKDGKLTLITFKSVKRRQAGLPPAKIAPPKPKRSKSAETVI
jgi:hypothetical protein